ncbi:MAG: high-potential iron-sulfur protein [Woeseiaceae bacterium]|nr:high-potential iron-sulfur protein [Woeseiaceae bacterium]
MNGKHEKLWQRRYFLKLVSGSAVIVPLAGIAACSGGEEPAQSAPPREAKPESGPSAAEEPVPQSAAPASQPAAGNMPRLEESDPQAKSLAYVHDATTVDASKYPQYREGNVCENCALYTGESGAEWGPCSIFPGKLVNAQGWCSVYAPKA